MPGLSQQQVDEIVLRTRRLATWVMSHRGKDERADNIYRYYEMLHKLPEPVAYLVLDLELKKVENERVQKR